MTKRYFIFLSYNGAQYCGWQIQPNGITIQEVVEKGLSILLKEKTAVLGAGRTDSGVHAKHMAAHFDCAISNIDLAELTFKLNNYLPKDIAVHKIVEVKHDAHARFDALSRTYRYYITTDKDPFLNHLKYRLYGDLDLDRMNECANVLFEYIDFTSFSKLHTDVKTNNCKILHAQWTLQATDYVFTIKANRFLRNMVRSIVGTLLLAGKHKIDVSQMREIIEAQDRGKAGSSVPGHALFLEEIEYPKEIFEI